MQKNPSPNLNKNSKFPTRFSRYTIFLLIIIGTAILIRMYFFPLQVPLNSDALYYFMYSSDIYQIGELPKDWSPTNNGWPIFVSLFFIIFDSKDIFTLMQIQRLLSVLISVSISIPVYFLCKKFVARKFAIVGVVLIAFEPRLMINSFLGSADPLYLLLVTASLTLFLCSNKKIVYFSFILVALATLVRGEGITLFAVMSIMFFVRYRKEKYKVFLKYLLVLGIFTSIVLPISIYRIEVIGVDGIFMRTVSSGDYLVSNLIVDNDSTNKFVSGLELFIKYLVWVMVPNFVIFVPLGLFLVFRNRSFEKNTLISAIGILSIPAFYAYTVPVLDTRYLYTLLPMFSVLVTLSIERIVGKLNKANIIIFIIIISIIVTSLMFYDYQKIDYESEKESFEITKQVSSLISPEKTNRINYSPYVKTLQIIDQWPNLSTQMKIERGIITTDYNSLEDYIMDSRNKGLTHIIVDSKKEHQDFLKEVFSEENKFPYLKKIYDSKVNGFNYHVKVFEIDYELFDSLKIVK